MGRGCSLTCDRHGEADPIIDLISEHILEAVHELAPTAKPSPYAKRWWSNDLTHLRRVYTYCRNGNGATLPDVEQQASAVGSVGPEESIRSRVGINPYLARIG